MSVDALGHDEDDVEGDDKLDEEEDLEVDDTLVDLGIQLALAASPSLLAPRGGGAASAGTAIAVVAAALHGLHGPYGPQLSAAGGAEAARQLGEACASSASGRSQGLVFPAVHVGSRPAPMHSLARLTSAWLALACRTWTTNMGAQKRTGSVPAVGKTHPP